MNNVMVVITNLFLGRMDTIELCDFWRRTTKSDDAKAPSNTGYIILPWLMPQATLAQGLYTEMDEAVFIDYSIHLWPSTTGAHWPLCTTPTEILYLPFFDSNSTPQFFVAVFVYVGVLLQA